MIDLRPYFPDSNMFKMRRMDGSEASRYSLVKNDPAIVNLYNQFLKLNKPGFPYMWRKEYMKNGSWCTMTYGILFMGDDLSVTEVGDWYAGTPCTPNVVLGYKTPQNVTSGLVWAPVGGLPPVGSTPVIMEGLNVWRQLKPGAAYGNTNYKTYSKVGVVEVLPEYTLPYGNKDGNGWRAGNGKTYQNVVRLVMYHGTKKPSNHIQVRCPNCPVSVSEAGPYYQSYKDYNSYAIELWLAHGVGIIQENTPFVEDGAEFGVTNCNGSLFAQYPWKTYIDQ